MVTAGAVDEDAPPEPPTLTPSVIVLDPAGRVSLDWTVFATDEEVEKYLPFDLGLEVELCVVFSLGVCLYAAADYNLPADEEPSLSPELEALISEMTDDEELLRCPLASVVAACLEHGTAAEHAATLRDLFALATSLTALGPSSMAALASDATPSSTSTSTPPPPSSSSPPASAFSQALARELAADEQAERAPLVEAMLAEIRSGVALRSVPAAERDASARLPAELDIIERLMAEIRSAPALRDWREREMAAHVPYATPHEALLSELVGDRPTLRSVPQPAAKRRLLLPTANPSSSSSTASLSHAPGDPASASGTPKRRLTLSVDTDELRNLLSWDPGTQVQLGFAADAAAGSALGAPDSTPPSPSEDGGSAASRRASDEEGGGGRGGGHNDGEDDHDDDDDDDEGVGSICGGPTGQPAPQFVKLSDIHHIRQALMRAELENLRDEDPALHARVTGKRVCASCRTFKFSLFNRARACDLCARAICSNCLAKVTLPSYMLDDDDSGSSRPTAMCKECRACMGGVTL